MQATAEDQLQPVAPPPQVPPHIAVFPVSSDCVDTLWDQVEPLLAKAVRREHGRFTTRDIYKWFLEGEQLLWVIARDHRVVAAGMVRNYRHPTGKLGSCWHLLGGEGAKDWAVKVIETWSADCRRRGVSEMQIVGRRGWLRYVRPYGFKVAGVLLTREEV